MTSQSLELPMMMATLPGLSFAFAIIHLPHFFKKINFVDPGQVFTYRDRNSLVINHLYQLPVGFHGKSFFMVGFHGKSFFMVGWQ
jgi:hypothetical protein